MPPHTSKSAPERVLPGIRKGEQVRELGDREQQLQDNRYVLRGVGVRTEGNRIWKSSKSAGETARRNALSVWGSTGEKRGSKW